MTPTSNPRHQAPPAASELTSFPSTCGFDQATHTRAPKPRNMSASPTPKNDDIRSHRLLRRPDSNPIGTSSTPVIPDMSPTVLTSSGVIFLSHGVASRLKIGDPTQNAPSVGILPQPISRACLPGSNSLLHRPARRVGSHFHSSLPRFLAARRCGLPARSASLARPQGRPQRPGPCGPAQVPARRPKPQGTTYGGQTSGL